MEHQNKNHAFLPKNPFFCFGKTFFWYFATYLLLPFQKIAFGLRIEKNKKFKQIKSGYVSICNHVHCLDCAMVANALGNCRSYYPTLKENLEVPLLGPLVRALGGLPIPTNTKGLQALSETISYLLEKGKGVHIFPEGELKPYERDLRELKRGAFKFAVENQVPLVPLTITFRDPKGIRKVVKKKPLLTITVLDPIFPDTSLPIKEEAKRLIPQAEIAMKQAIHNK